MSNKNKGRIAIVLVVFLVVVNLVIGTMLWQANLQRQDYIKKYDEINKTYDDLKTENDKQKQELDKLKKDYQTLIEP